jgi:hypothetical protein
MMLSKGKELHWRKESFLKQKSETDILELLKDRNKNKSKIIEALDREIQQIKQKKVSKKK